MTRNCAPSAKLTTWQTNIELTLCFFASSFTKLITSQLAAESSPLVGSSRNKILGLVISCAATLTLLFWPPDTPLRIGVPMRVSAWSCRPNDDRSPSMRALRSALLTEL
jgi:CHASE2 domain-containing sensor protein